MTQFIIVTGDPADVSPPPGIDLQPVEESSCVARTVAHLLPAHPTCLFKVVEHESGEADLFIDNIHNTHRYGEKPLGPDLLQFLRILVTQGRSVVCWYGEDVSDLPVFRTWPVFEEAVLRDAAKQPPEVYAIILSPAPEGGSAE